MKDKHTATVFNIHQEYTLLSRTFLQKAFLGRRQTLRRNMPPPEKTWSYFQQDWCLLFSLAGVAYTEVNIE